MRLARGEWGMPKTASVPALKPEMTALAAFLAIARTCLHDFMLNEAALASPADIEGVHQARIAIRRLRAAFSLFAPLIGDPQFAHLKGELKWIARLLGAARDLDVLASDPAIPKEADALTSAISHRRDAAHSALAESLGSRRMRLFLLDLAIWLDQGSWTAARRRPLAKPVMDIVCALLERRLAKLRKACRDLIHLGPRKRHRIRIAAKKLRYMCEFFEILVAGGAAKGSYRKLIRALKKLQDNLGTLQDAATMAMLLTDIVEAADEPDSLKREADRMAKAAGIDRKEELRKAEKAAAKIRDAKPFWLKLQRGELYNQE